MCFDLMNDATKTRKTTKRVRAIFVISSQIEFIILPRAGFCLPHWLCCEKKIIAANGDVIPFIRFALIIALSPCSECLFNCLPSLMLKVPFLAAQPPAPLCPSRFVVCRSVLSSHITMIVCQKGRDGRRLANGIPFLPHFLLFIAIFLPFIKELAAEGGGLVTIKMKEKLPPKHFTPFNDGL